MIERGERVAHVETLAALAGALGVRLSDLFLQTEQPPENGEPEALARPLWDFVRNKRLTSADIDRLLGVARVMFGGQALE
jgi:hypothetical protein